MSAWRGRLILYIAGGQRHRIGDGLTLITSEIACPEFSYYPSLRRLESEDCEDPFYIVEME